MEVAIRRATAADARPAADLWLRARRAALGAIPAPVHTDSEVRDWFAGHVVPDAELWLAGDGDGGGALAGLLVLDGGELDQLYVAPELTGCGIGSALVEHAKRLRPDGLALWTFQSNAGAQRFYARHGFAVVARTDGRDNEERAPDVRYAWPSRPASRAAAAETIISTQVSSGIAVESITRW